MTGVVITIPGEAVPYARSGGNGKVRFTPAKQRHAMARARDLAAAAMNGRPPLEGPLSINALFVYLHPASWSKRRRESTFWKSNKPDGSNLIKLIEDAFNSVVWRDDAQVASLTVEKFYGSVAEVVVSVQQIPSKSDGLRQAGGATGGSGESPASSFTDLTGAAQPS